MKKEQIQFAKDKDWNKTFLWTWNAFYSKKDCETVVLDATENEIKDIKKWKQYNVDEKKKTIKVL